MTTTAKAPRVYNKGTGRGKSPWSGIVEEYSGSTWFANAIKQGDQIIQTLAEFIVGKHSDVFAKAFIGGDDNGKDLVLAVPHVCMELKYGEDRSKWPERAFCRVAGADKEPQLWASYGTTTPIRVPNPSNLLHPITFGTKDGFHVKWFVCEDKKQGPLEAKLHSKHFDTEQEAAVFVVAHFKRHGITASPFVVHEKGVIGAADECKTKTTAQVVEAFMAECKESKRLTYDTLAPIVKEIPDLAKRVLEAGDAKLAECVATMQDALVHIGYLVDSLEKSDAFTKAKHSKLVREAWSREPALIGYIERRHTAVASKYGANIAACVCRLFAKQLYDEMQTAKGELTPNAARWMLSLPPIIARGAQNELARKYPKAFAVYKESWPAVHAQILFDRVTDEKSFDEKAPHQRMTVMETTLEELNVLTRRPVFEALVSVIAARIIDSQRPLSPTLATLCAFLRERVMRHLEAADIVHQLMFRPGSETKLLRQQLESGDDDVSDQGWAGMRRLVLMLLVSLASFDDKSPACAVLSCLVNGIGSNINNKQTLETAAKELKALDPSDKDLNQLWKIYSLHGKADLLEHLMSKLDLDASEKKALASIDESLAAPVADAAAVAAEEEVVTTLTFDGPEIVPESEDVPDNSEEEDGLPGLEEVPGDTEAEDDLPELEALDLNRETTRDNNNSSSSQS